MQTKTTGSDPFVPRAIGRPARSPRKPRPRKESHTIAYRVDVPTLAWLSEGAAPYGISIHEYARQKLLETAQAKEVTAMRAEVADAKHEMKQLREDLAVTLEVLLTNLTSSDPTHIRAWINENLRGT